MRIVEVEDAGKGKNFFLIAVSFLLTVAFYLCYVYSRSPRCHRRGKNEGLITRGKGSPQKFKVSTGKKGLIRKIVVKQEL
jgi:hypothetical protein